MKKTHWFSIALAAAVFAGGYLPQTSIARDAASHRPLFRGLLIESALGLTDQQTTQIRAILKAEKDTLTHLLTRLHEARIGLRQAIRAPGATEASVRAASAKVAAVASDLAVERFKLHGKINPILTDEQRSKIAAWEQRLDDFIDNVINRVGQRLAE